MGYLDRQRYSKYTLENKNETDGIISPKLTLSIDDCRRLQGKIDVVRELHVTYINNKDKLIKEKEKSDIANQENQKYFSRNSLQYYIYSYSFTSVLRYREDSAGHYWYWNAAESYTS